MKLKNILFGFVLALPVACTNLDISPINMVGDKDIFGNEAGVTSQISRFYSILPLEDFRYKPTQAGLFNSNSVIYEQLSCMTGEAISRSVQSAITENVSYWDAPYSYIREVNSFLETLPDYASEYTQEQMDKWMGEAYFVRAYIYYSLVKRYGGVPIVDKVIDYPGTVSFEGTKLFRDSEEKTWDFIGEDLDRAISLLPETNQKGRANKYAAAALLSRVMLHAGSIAKYNTVDEEYNNVRICGIPAEKAKGYFAKAYEATSLFDNGKYSLYKGKWSSSDKKAQTENFLAIFSDDTEETIFARYYKDPDSMHGFDNATQPRQTSTGGDDSDCCPSLDFVEMFEFDGKNPDGTIANFDADGKYKLYDSPIDAFEGCEPRLAATVILPMSEFKGQTIDLRRGIWTGAAVKNIGRLVPEGDIANYNSRWAQNSDLKMSNSESFNNIADNFVTLKNGAKMKRAGASGIFSEWDFGNVSGFYLRKYMNDDPSSDNNGNKSTQAWIEIRYAEVLLNRAEAAWELASLGEAADKEGRNYLETATDCINRIRERGGAALLGATLENTEADRDVIRIERRKELAFENKTYWDLKRWRIIDKEQYSNKRWRTLNAFYSVEDEKYFLDVHYQEPRAGFSYVFDFDERWYYQQIPVNEPVRNPNCKQNPGY